MPKLPVIQTRSPYQRFLQRWGKGCGGEICSAACNVVLGRGHVPCDVLFVGEAPGRSEDISGQPFVGPAGQILNYIIDNALPESVGECPALKVTLTNLVCCLPLYEGQHKEDKPADEDILRCQPRLKEFIEICSPRLVVAVGKTAEDFLKPSTYRDRIRLAEGVRFFHMTHPAAVVRTNSIMQGVMIQRLMVQLRDAVEEAGLLSEGGGEAPP